jgi:hypothetical protein
MIGYGARDQRARISFDEGYSNGFQVEIRREVLLVSVLAVRNKRNNGSQGLFLWGL